MPTDDQLRFADHLGRYVVREMNMPPVAGRLLGYLGVCDPAEQTINELADALLASRSAVTQAVVLLESIGLVRRSRARGERVDRVAVHLDVDIFERDLDATGYVEQAALLRQGAALLGGNDKSGRREALKELAALNDFMAERLPQLKEEWRARRSGLT
jgi:hypothetical protein